MTATCNFVSFGDEMREPLVKLLLVEKKEKREEKKKKINAHMIGLKKAQNFCAVLQCFLAKLNES